MKRLQQSILLCLVAALSGPAFAQAPQPNNADDENQRAGAALGTLGAWRRQPAIFAGICESVDPPGIAARKAAQAEWAANNRASLAKIDAYIKEFVPRVLPPITNDVMKDFDAMILEKLSEAIKATPPPQLLYLCQHFRDLPPVSTEKTESVVREGTAVLDKWRQGHPR